MWPCSRWHGLSSLAALSQGICGISTHSDEPSGSGLVPSSIKPCPLYEHALRLLISCGQYGCNMAVIWISHARAFCSDHTLLWSYGRPSLREGFTSKVQFIPHHSVYVDICVLDKIFFKGLLFCPLEASACLWITEEHFDVEQFRWQLKEQSISSVCDLRGVQENCIYIALHELVTRKGGWRVCLPLWRLGQDINASAFSPNLFVFSVDEEDFEEMGWWCLPVVYAYLLVL